ncbi:MAG: putative transposase [Granulosicoccus sp.]|jgi:transposase-like protein
MEESKRIERGQCKYLNNIVEQDHRLIKRITKPMLGFKNFYCAQKTLAGIKMIRMLKKSPMRCQVNSSKTPVGLFYKLAG